MKSTTAVRHRSLIASLRHAIAGASLTALFAAVASLATPLTALAQSTEQPPRPDPDGDYGDNLSAFEADGPLLAVVSLGSQQIRVFDRNGMVASSKVSTGRKGHDTPEGIFSIIERKVEHNSNLYDDAEMPFMQRITWSGVALHQGVVPGYRASHGCIRLPEEFAERLFRTTRIATRVVIVSHDATPLPVSHAVLPQPGDAPAVPPAPSAAPEAATPLTAPDHTGAITIAATADDASSARDAAIPTPAKPQPTLAELRARRIDVEKRLAVATKAVNQAKLPVRPRLIEQGKTEKALRQAVALANRAAGRAEVMARAPFETTTDAAWTSAVADHIEALIEHVASKTREDWAREVAARSAAAAMAAQDEVRKLDTERQAILNQSRSIARRLSPVTVFVSRDTGRVYVHQAFHPVMELPVQIKDPDRRLGTHVFTAHQIDDRDDAVRWVGITLETPEGRSPLPTEAAAPKKRRKGEPEEAARPGRDALASARAALDRVELPPAVLARIMPTLQPGSTVIVSDLAKSIETGPGTDIVVQTRGEEEAARSIANFVARKRGETLGLTETSYKPRSRERNRDWERW